MRGTFLFIGTSASTGVPRIGCSCSVCTSTSPFNKRLRPSGIFHLKGKTLLLDVGPDFYSQAIKYKINHLDGLILTHTHYDHIAGIDELRIFYVLQKKPFPCLLSYDSYQDIKKRYDYFFEPPKNKGSLSAQLEFHILTKDIGDTEFLGIRMHYFSYSQGGMKVTGFRIGDFAYVSDIRDYDESIYQELKGVRTLVLSALRPEPTKLHLSFDEAVAFSKRVGAHQTWLTHLGHFLDHEKANALLPQEVRLAYDGLILEFDYADT